MFVGITNTPRDYAWGSHTAIASLLGTSPSGKPEAELWLGAHAGSPSVIVDPAAVGGARDLAAWIAADPATALGQSSGSASGAGSLFTDGHGPRLPFLLKILAAGSPLSLQAHPSPARARAGFALENAAGVPLDAADRNYKDPFHKPELIFALSETFEALCGFRSLDSIRLILDELRVLDATTDDPQPAALDALEGRLLSPGAEDALRDVVDWLLRDGRGEGSGENSGEVTALVERVVALAGQAAFLADGGAHVDFAREFATVRSLASVYPGDPGIVLSLLLNRVSLRRGEVLYLPAGNIHAYLSGVGVELMAASDNVLRGGLTPKHIDVDELLDVLDFAPLPVPILEPSSSHSAVPSPGVSVYRPDVPDFELVHIEAPASGAAAARSSSAGSSAGSSSAGSSPAGSSSAGSSPARSSSADDVPMRQFALTGPGIAICTAGGFLVAGAASSVTLKRGQAVYITPDEGMLTFAGAGEVFLATTPA